MKYYAVACGSMPGIHRNGATAWECINGFPGGRMRAFPDIFLAVAYYNLYKGIPRTKGADGNRNEIQKKAGILKRSYSEKELFERYAAVSERPGHKPTAPPKEEPVQSVTKTKPDTEKPVAKPVAVNPPAPPPEPVSELVPKPEKIRNWRVYTDGSYDDEAKVGGYAALIFWGFKPYPFMVSGTANLGSSYEMELLAIVRALDALKERYTGNGTVTVYTDCMTIADVAENSSYEKWKRKKYNKDFKETAAYRKKLWKKVFKRKKQLPVHFEWVKAHHGNELNEQCDNIAKTEVTLWKNKAKAKPVSEKKKKKKQKA